MSSYTIAALPGYYSLYALYFDYPINNAFFAGEEKEERLMELLSTVKRMEELVQPYRKSWALRLFTERVAMARFSPELVNELLRQLRGMVEQLGPPPGWSRGSLPRMKQTARQQPRAKAATAPDKAPGELRRSSSPFAQPPFPLGINT